jgi:hypothetical protein
MTLFGTKCSFRTSLGDSKLLQRSYVGMHTVCVHPIHHSANDSEQLLHYFAELDPIHHKNNRHRLQRANHLTPIETFLRHHP